MGRWFEPKSCSFLLGALPAEDPKLVIYVMLNELKEKSTMEDK